MSEKDQIRKNVSASYAKAVTTPGPETCCCGGTAQKGVIAKIAGYSRDELNALPPDAVANSFGCGNPIALSEIKEGDVVVDLGSGAGIDILLAGKKVGPKGRVLGVDMTDEMIARARGNVATAGLDNVEVRKGIIEDMPVESNSADWVISNCVINLSPEKEKVFAEIARVLRPGGRMLVSDIVVEDMPDWLRGSRELYDSCIAGAIPEEKYLSGLRVAGLVDVEVRDRLYYDAAQMRAFVASELPGSDVKLGCCGQSSNAESLDLAVNALVGKIWSVKVYARKPLA